jgi:hypothetical protein
LKKWTPQLWDELKGISAGSGIDFDTIFAFQLVDEMWTSARLIDLPRLRRHCTAMGINNYRKNKGGNILAQTLDFTPFYHGFQVLLDIRDEKSGTRKMIVTFCGYLGANGRNKHIGITCNSLLDLQSSLNGLPVCCVVRGVLDRGSFRQAEKFIKSVKHASGQNYIIGSGTEVKSFECSAGLAVEFWPDSSRLYTYHTNHSLANKDYHPKYVDYLRKSKNTTPDAYRPPCMRFKSLEERIKGNPDITMQTIKETLASKDYQFDPICNATTWVAVIMRFAKNNNTIMIAPGKPDSTAYVEIKIDSLLWPR